MPKNIILDIDETLIHAVEERRKISELKKDLESDKFYDKKNDFFIFKLINRNEDYENSIKDTYYCFKRPGLDEFLSYCLDNFDRVIICSAGTKTYVEEIVKNLFKNLGQPDGVYSRYDCLLPDGNMDKIQKPIVKIADMMNLPKEINLKNSFLVDDREYNSISNHKNKITVPQFYISSPDDFLKSQDTVLYQLIDLFESQEFKNCEDIRDINIEIFK